MGAEQSICAPGDGAGCCEARQADTIVRSQVRRTKGAAFSQVSLPFLAGLHTGAEAGAPTGHQQDATPLKPRTPVTPNASPGTPLSSPPSPWTPESQRTPGSPQTPRGGFYGASTPNSRRLENIKDKLKSLHKRVDVQLIVKKNDDIEEATGAAGRLLLHATRINSAAAPLAPEPLSIRELAKQVGSPRASRTTRQCARCLAVLGLGEMQRGECLACGTSTEIRKAKGGSSTEERNGFNQSEWKTLKGLHESHSQNLTGTDHRIPKGKALQPLNNRGEYAGQVKEGTISKLSFGRGV